jgi:hypothetical protein
MTMLAVGAGVALVLLLICAGGAAVWYFSARSVAAIAAGPPADTSAGALPGDDPSPPAAPPAPPQLNKAAPPSGPEPWLPALSVEELKAASVYIEAESTDTAASHSGFVVCALGILPTSSPTTTSSLRRAK